MKTIKQSYKINAPGDEVWQALVDPKIIEKWGAGPAQMDDKVGTRFKLWGGDIHGRNTEVVKNKKLVQDWYGGNWQKPSKLTFELTNLDGKTQVELVHEDVPDKEAENIEDGWERYYMGPLKDYLESKL